MKAQLTFFSILIISSSVFAGQMCVDRRAAMIEPCAQGQEHHFVKGTCKKSSDFMGLFCVEPAKKILEIKGDVLQIEELNGMVKVTIDEEAEVLKRDKAIAGNLAEEFANNGFEATAKTTLGIKACENAIISVEVGEGNILPNADGTEVYKLAEILSFNCAK